MLSIFDIEWASFGFVEDIVLPARLFFPSGLKRHLVPRSPRFVQSGYRPLSRRISKPQMVCRFENNQNGLPGSPSSGSDFNFRSVRQNLSHFQERPPGLTSVSSFKSSSISRYFLVSFARSRSEKLKYPQLAATSSKSACNWTESTLENSLFL